MDDKATIKYVKDIIKDYINDFKMQNWVANNMIYYRNRLDNSATPEKAFMYVIQSATSRYKELSFNDQQKIGGTLWHLLKNKNHSLTRLW